MMHMSSGCSDHSDILSQETSSPAPYFVQSPSETDKSSTNSNHLTINSPSDQSPSHQSSGSGSWFSGWRHSRTGSSSRPSSASWISSSGGRMFRGAGKRFSGRSRGWKIHYWQVIDEEGRKRFPGYEDGDGNDDQDVRCCQIWLGLFMFGVVFGAFCFVLWGASRPYQPHILLKKLTVKNFYTGEGSDQTGVPTKVLTVDSSLVMRVHNPATFYGIHVSATSVNLLYYDLIIASGQMTGFYQPRSSWRNLNVSVRADKVPLYGASLGFTTDVGTIPLNLELEFSTKGYVVGKLVQTHHKLRISCPISIHPNDARLVHFSLKSCRYD